MLTANSWAEETLAGLGFPGLGGRRDPVGKKVKREKLPGGGGACL